MKTKINKTRRVIKFLLIAISLLFISSCSFNANENKEKLYVYNWGIYIDKTTIEDFEKKYDCKVIYDELKKYYDEQAKIFSEKIQKIKNRSLQLV